ncbi:hypothetical protein E1295_36730 [Nonomuraea mesophila]|uniref:Uncharacterized protein n=1 Tax=Nonomuraea mesophila TaxID=2530382 RepID=A0A4R5EK12_9ACTN|nr:hypothetical protein [Nonomuraea mesophila]TDE34762.1 hypothetical protein E1295_36730 [Nonomuraea mesophila]
MNKSIFAAFASAAAIAVVSLTPVAAHADPPPSNCISDFGYQPNWTYARCSTGSGYVQAIAKCSNGSKTTYAYGPWKYIGVTSAAHCPDSHNKAVGHDYNIKGY